MAGVTTIKPFQAANGGTSFAQLDQPVPSTAMPGYAQMRSHGPGLGDYVALDDSPKAAYLSKQTFGGPKHKAGGQEGMRVPSTAMPGYEQMRCHGSGLEEHLAIDDSPNASHLSKQTSAGPEHKYGSQEGVPAIEVDGKRNLAGWKVCTPLHLQCCC